MGIREISLEKCKECFSFDESGRLFWKIDNGRNSVGVEACKVGTGLTIQKQKHFKHKILYQLYHDEYVGTDFIKHKDGNSKNNIKENLIRINKKVKPPKKDGISGIKNVFPVKIDGVVAHYKICFEINKIKYVKYANKYTRTEKLKEIRDQFHKELIDLHEFDSKNKKGV